jgi:hypothetical protein
MEDLRYYAVTIRRAAQYRFIRSLTALRAVADILRRRGRWAALAFVTGPASRLMMNDSGSSSGSYESRRCGNSPIRFLVSRTNSRNRTSAPRLASSNRWASRLRRGMLSVIVCRVYRGRSLGQKLDTAPVGLVPPVAAVAVTF